MDVPVTEAIGGALGSAVRRALGRDATLRGGWRVEPLAASMGSATGGVHRVTGEATDHRGARLPWALVLKVVLPPAAGGPDGSGPTRADPAHHDYWAREPLLYRSGLLDDLPGGLAAPRCYGVEERPDGAVWLWLEALDGGAAAWPLTRYGRAARDLGRFNGAYLAGRPLPAADWLSRDWVRGFRARWGALRDAGLAGDPAAWAAPLARSAFPRPLGARVLRMWDDAEAFCAVLDRLPRTFCHRDANRTNLFRPGGHEGERTVAVDWAFAGDGAVGEEIVQLVVSTLWRGAVAPDDGARLSAVVWSNYLAGLRAAGWRGDERLARLGYAAGAVARWDYLPGAALRLANDAPWRAEIEAYAGRSGADMLASVAAGSHLLLDLADEARELAGIAR